MARDSEASWTSLASARTTTFERVLEWGAALAVLAAVAWSIPRWPHAWRWMTGREPLYEPEHPVALDAVDLDAVHRRHFGAWLIAADQATPGVEDAQLDEARAAMREAIAADANLGELFEELDDLVTSGRIDGEAAGKRALWLTRAWSQYLSDHDAPYFVHAGILVGHRVLFYAHTYRVVATTSGTVDEETYRVRALSRLDTLNLRELYLGYASNLDEGALLIGDRVVELALDRIWPMLGERVSGDRLRRAYAAPVASEARRDLPGDAYARLAATADARADLLAAYDAIVDRRDCSRLWIPRPSPTGYDDETLDEMVDAIDTGPCAGIEPSEMTALRTATRVLRQAEGLEEALERLVAWVARPVAVHELRHVADDDAYDLDEGRPCEVCTATDPAMVEAEVAAYAAELAWSDAPAAAMYQVCETTTGDEGAHARARAVLMKAIGAACEDGLPADLATSVRALEDEALDGSQPIVLAPDFPDRLPLTSRAP